MKVMKIEKAVKVEKSEKPAKEGQKRNRLGAKSWARAKGPEYMTALAAKGPEFSKKFTAALVAAKVYAKLHAEREKWAAKMEASAAKVANAKVLMQNVEQMEAEIQKVVDALK